MRRILSVLAGAAAMATLAALVAVTIGVATDAWRIVPVRSGSMEPAIPTGSAALTRPVDAADLQVGDVVVFHPPTDDRALLIHRIVEIETVDGQRAFRTQGDANRAPDPWLLRFGEAELWRVSRVVPVLGHLEHFMADRPVRLGVLALGATLVLAVGVAVIWRRREDDPPPGPERSAGEPPLPDLDLSGEVGESADEPVRAPSPRGVERRVRVRGRAVIRGSAVLALVLTGALLVGQSAHGAFTVGTDVSAPYETGVLNAPSPLTCAWAPFGGGSAPLLWTFWSTAGQNFADGYHVFRSDVSGGPYDLRATKTPNTQFVHIENPTPHTQVRYYVVESFRGDWTSPFTNEVPTNECKKAINAFAGDGTTGFSGDGGPATAAQLDGPRSVAFDSAGNTYIADMMNNRVRIVDPSGTIDTFAGGSGTASPCTYEGDVADLRLNQPRGIAVDSHDNVYIADSGQNCVRKVDPSGNVTLFAGGGSTTSCLSSGPATSVSLSLPIGLTLDAQDVVYIADSGRNCVRKVVDGTYSHVVGGGEEAGCATSGPATSVSLSIPVDVAVDTAGDVYVTDALNHCVRKVSAGTYSQVAGGGTSTACDASGDPTTLLLGDGLSFPVGVVVNAAGAVFLADTHNNCVRRIANGTYTQVAFTGTEGHAGDNGPAVEALGTAPLYLAVDAAGDLYISSAQNQAVRRVIQP